MPGVHKKASGQVQLRHAQAYKFYMEPRRDILLTKIHFLQTLRDMPFFAERRGELCRHICADCDSFKALTFCSVAEGTKAFSEV